MINKTDFEATCKRYEEFWAKENHDRPLIYTTAPRDNFKPKKVAGPADLRERWLDTEYVIKSSRAQFESTYYGGESYPILCPNYGPDFFGAVLGCGIEFGETTSWAIHGEAPFSERPPFQFDENNNDWWQRMKSLTQAVVEDAKQGDYFVGITDMHGGMDGLVSLRGPQELCYDLYDEPEEIKNRANEEFEIYKTAMSRLFAMTSKYQRGSSHWMSLWHPGNWFNISCDFMGMLSEEMFDEFVLPQVEKELDLYDASMFHVDGPGALKHIDKLLELPKLNGIQWVYGAGNPTAAHWIPLLKKIQAAGKCIHIDITMEDANVLLRELKPEGLMLCAYCQSEADSKIILEKAEKSYKKRLF